MKKLSIMIFILGVVMNLNAQSYAVAVNDTVECRLGESVTVNVLENDYHVDGLEFYLLESNNGKYWTSNDTSITFYAEYEEYYRYSGFDPTSVRGYYRLVDENGNFDLSSFAYVVVKIVNNNFYDTLDRNNIATYVINNGCHFWRGPGYDAYYPNDTAIFYEYPKGSRKSLIFTSTLWVGGMDEENQLRLSAQTHRERGFDFWSGPISVFNGNISIDTSTVIEWNKIWKLNIEDVQYHINNFSKPGYRAIPEILRWPAHGDVNKGQAKYIAPFVDVDGDGFYRPLKGDYPLIKGHQCAFFIFNDLRTKNRETGNSNIIGIEVHGMMYQFEDAEDSIINNTTFLSYKIFNRSKHTLSNTYIGIWSDPDVGYAKDDYIGYDVGRSMYFGYNGEEVDGNGEFNAYGENPPVVGIVFLGGPYIDINDIDNPAGGCDESINGKGFGDGIIDNERYGMTGFVMHHSADGPQSDPSSAKDYYNYFRMRWKDSTEVQYGGVGCPEFSSYGPSCKFMYPGVSDPCNWGTEGVAPNGPVDWTEFNGYNGEPNSPNDRFGLGSCGPFTFKPGDVQKIDIAYVAARGDDGLISSLELLRVYADTLHNRFAQNTDDFGTQYLDVDEASFEIQSLEVYPNPVSDIITVVIPQGNTSTHFELYNIFGQKVIHQSIPSSQKKLNVDVSDLPDGIYVCAIISKKHSTSARIIKK